MRPWTLEEVEPEDTVHEDCLPRPIGPSQLEKLLPRPNTLVGAISAAVAVASFFLARRFWK